MKPAHQCDEHEAVITYLYGECDPDERERVEAHLSVCRRCADELDALQSVRGALETWTPPEPALGFRIVSERDAARETWWRRPLAPSWGVAAAAALVLVVGVALASVEVRYGGDGFLFRMGWTELSPPALSPNGSVPAASASAEPPWMADLVSLESELRQELAARPVVGPSEVTPPSATMPADVARDDDRLVERIQTLIAQSEQRQQAEIALWLTEFAQEFDMQRRADQQSLQQELGALEGFADMLVRVSQR